MKTKRKKKSAAKTKVAGEGQTRGYREVVSFGGVNSDWPFTILSEDSDVWLNAWALTSRVRDLFRTNPLYTRYRELLWAGVLGKSGHVLRSLVKETEDRVIHTPDEAKALIAHEKRINRIRTWAAKRDGRTVEQYRAFQLADTLERQKSDTVIRGQAMIQAGAPDVFANQLIEKAWGEWCKGKNCDSRGQRSYNALRKLRLIGAVRDGDIFIRKIRAPKANDFGFTLQLISAEWCDRFYNDILSNGNVVRMGIEYEMNDWGIGKMVAFYFIVRQPMDWQFSTPGTYTFGNRTVHERISVDDVIHYARPIDADATRPAPWVCSTIPAARQLNQYIIAEVVAAREAACKIGFYYADDNPEGGELTQVDPRTGIPTEQMGPGDKRGLPRGVKYQEVNPTHPTANFETFKTGMVQSIAGGMPGGDYSRLNNDYAAINFSAGRLQMLDTNEIYRGIQTFDVETAETPIFEDWLEMALIMGAIKGSKKSKPLPLSKIDKFNCPFFHPKGFFGIDEMKEEQASAIRIANKKTSRQRECALYGTDWEEIALELAEEEMLLEELGMTPATTADTPVMRPPQQPQQGEQEQPADPTAANGSNGSDPDEEDDEHDDTIKFARF